MGNKKNKSQDIGKIIKDDVAPRVLVKYVAKAGMWCTTTFASTKGTMTQTQAWSVNKP